MTVADDINFRRFSEQFEFAVADVFFYVVRLLTPLTKHEV